jgi:hypothetical protein
MASSITYFDIGSINSEFENNANSWLASDEIFPRPSFAIRPEVQIKRQKWPANVAQRRFEGKEAIFLRSLRSLIRHICRTQTLREVAMSSLGECYHDKLAWHFLQGLFCLIFDAICRRRSHDWWKPKDHDDANRSEIHKFKLRLDDREARLKKHTGKPPIAKETLRRFLEQMLLGDYGLSNATVQEHFAQRGDDISELRDLGGYLASFAAMTYVDNVTPSQLQNVAWIVGQVAPAAWDLGLQTPDVILYLIAFDLDHGYQKTDREKKDYEGVVWAYVHDSMPSWEFEGIRRKISVDICDIIPAVTTTNVDQVKLKNRAMKVLRKLPGPIDDTVCLKEGPYATPRIASYTPWLVAYVDLENDLSEAQIVGALRPTEKEYVIAKLAEEVRRLPTLATQPPMKDSILPFMKDAIQALMKDAIQSLMKDAIQPLMKDAIQSLMKDAIQPLMEDAIQPLMKDAIQSLMKDAIQPLMEDKDQVGDRRRRSTLKKDLKKQYCMM